MLKIHSYFHEPTSSVTHLVWDEALRHAAVIDPVLDYDGASAHTATTFIDGVLSAAAGENLSIRWILETHAHADHLSAAAVVKERTGAQTVIGAGIRAVQTIFKDVFDDTDLVPDGTAFDLLVREGDRLPLGALTVEVLETPGHTPACVSYKIADAVFVGDTLLMPDYGTARADFPGGDAGTLYRSIHKILSLPDETRLYLCHDYKPPGRDRFAWETTVADERARNVHVHKGISEAEFVATRTARDRTLTLPALIIPAVQVNIRGGRLPTAAANGTRYLKIPVNRL